MKLYHGTNTYINEIDFNKCNPNKDFGQGFYLTDIKEQALLMAKRRAKIEKQGHPIIMEYEFDENGQPIGETRSFLPINPPDFNPETT